MKRASEVIAETFGFDINEMKEYEYQKYISPKVYSIGDNYYAVHKTKPKHKDVGGEWIINKDQFFAQKENTILWKCSSL